MINRLNPNYSQTPELTCYKVNYLPSEALPVTPAVVVISCPATLVAAQNMYASLQRQTLQNWHWLIACTSPTLLTQLVELTTEPRVKLLSQYSVELASPTCDYITLLEQGVSWEPTFLEKSLWFLASNTDYSFCGSYSVVHGEKEGLLVPSISGAISDLEKKHNFCSSFVVRRSVFCKIPDAHSLLTTQTGNSNLLAGLVTNKIAGHTITEFLQWYHHSDSVPAAMDSNTSIRMEPKGFQRSQPQAFETVPDNPPFLNPLRSTSKGRRVMFILPWMVEGGADRVNIDLIDGLVRTGNTVTVCNTLAADHRWEHLFAEHTADIFVLPNILAQADYPRFFTYLINSRKIDTVIISGSTIGYQLLPYLRACCPRTAFLDLSHTEEPHWLNGGHPRFGVGYQDALDMNIVTTAHLAKWMAGRGADPQRVRIMHTGIRSLPAEMSAEELMRLRAHYGLDSAGLKIIFAGRMCEQKRPLLLVEILRAARDAHINFNAVLIGDGELRPALEALIAKYDLSGMVQVLGARPHNEWLELLALADVLLMPSAYEGISVALLESMAAGAVPVVARVGGQAELISPELGYLIPHNKDELEQYVGALSELARDRDALSRRGKACRQLIECNFTADATHTCFMKIIDEAHRHRYSMSGVEMTPKLARELATLALEYKRLTEYMDVLHAGHSLTGAAQVSIGRETRIAYALARRLSRSRIVALMLRSPRLTRIARKLISYVR